MFGVYILDVLIYVAYALLLNFEGRGGLRRYINQFTILAPRFFSFIISIELTLTL